MKGQFRQSHKKGAKEWLSLACLLVLVLMLGYFYGVDEGCREQEELVFRDSAGEVVSGEAIERERALEVTLLPPDPTGDVVVVFGSIWDDCLMRWSGPDWDTCLRPDGEVEQNGEVVPDAVEFWRLLGEAFPQWQEEACGGAPK